MDIGLIACLAACGVGLLGFLVFLIWLIVRIVNWDSKWPSILGMILSLALLGGGAYFTLTEHPDFQIPYVSGFVENVKGFLQKDGGEQGSGSFGAEKGLLKVKITVPAYFLEEIMTQEQLDETVKEEKNVQSATLNEDGSVTYEMNRLQHWKMMREVRKNIDQGLSELEGSAEYPNFVSIKANRNYTKYTVTVSAEELGLMDSMSVLGFYMLSGTYHAFNGSALDNVSVKFVNEETEEVIEEFDSSDLEEDNPVG